VQRQFAMSKLTINDNIDMSMQVTDGKLGAYTDYGW